MPDRSGHCHRHRFPAEIIAHAVPFAYRVNRKLAVSLVPSVNVSVRSRQLFAHALSDFQT
jgi:hypothetical protein